ncbi:MULTISPECIES: serine/threonine protein kinase [unclassified Roseateles]|uniref:serine/threonine protein kinase n=1 Tax=unclassified Roseateles TaxID=2626991 RepID=UPI0006F95C5A|nr:MULTISPECIES: serine/threonine protein kinase [unclassified Roseateles]KQW51656.1 serine/threonine protein kinase [Pelomonas sp. Root405]KRA77889.1 serine/threonine protein kinase [Pelomonas sp. Root662]
MHQATPDLSFGDLTPEFMLDALDAAGLRADGRLLQLNSFENRVLMLHLEDDQFGSSAAVAKFYRPGRWSDAQILEEHAFAAELAAAEVPVAAPWTLGGGSTLFHFQGQRLAVTPRQGGRGPELEDPEVLRWIGRLLARLHGVGRQRPFAERLAWASAAPAQAARDWLIGHEAIPAEIAPQWDDAARRCIDTIQAAFDSLPDLQLTRLHGDCHPGNILWTPDRGPHFVDLDDAVTGPVVQDLWMLLPGSTDEPDAARRLLNAVLDGYEQIAEFDDRELRLIEPLRTMRMIHHSAWLARRWGDPAFPLAFPWFGTPNYWLDQVAKLREQLEAMKPKDAPPSLARDEDAVDFDGDGFS